jgi:uncharacterized protein (DUF3084 family)
MIDDAEKRVTKKNFAKLNECSEVEEVKKEKHLLMQEVQEVKKEKSQAMQELALLKDSQKQLKEEKKKLEYMLYDLLKASDANKGKLQRIKQIMEE